MVRRALSVNTVLHNAKIFTEGRIVKGGVAIEEGKIIRVAKKAHLPSASNEINLHGYLLLPGLIDIHVHLRDQLQTYEEDFFTGTAAAVAGGITSVLDMPNNEPVTMDCVSLRKRIEEAKCSTVANVGFYSAFPRNEDEITSVINDGAVAFKLFLNTQIGGLDIKNDDALFRAFNKVSELGAPVAVHAEDQEAVETAAELEQRLGHKDIEAYLKAHKPEVEAKAVERILRIARKTNVQIHLCHISSKQALALINGVRKRGLMVSCEITPHHLLLTDEDLKRQGTMLLTNPPVRNKNIMNELWDAVRRGQIDVIASDHAPHLVSEKTADSAWNVKPGIPGLETLLPLLLTKVNEGRLTIANLVKLTAERPAEIFRLHNEGFLKEGCNANLTVVDMKRREKIKSHEFYSKAKYSPFDGWSVKGMPIKTFVNGQLVMDEGEVVAKPGAGRIIRSG